MINNKNINKQDIRCPYCGGHVTDIGILKKQLICKKCGKDVRK